MNDLKPGPLCRRPGIALVGTLALAAAGGCGGRAASPELSDEAPGEASESMPQAFDVLEVRRLFDTAADGERANCGEADYAERLKVNMGTGQLIAAVCSPDPGGGASSSIGRRTLLLEPTQLGAVRDAYRQVRESNGHECASAADTLTLGVTIDREEVLFADADRRLPCARRRQQELRHGPVRPVRPARLHERALTRQRSSR